jgi:hypothetical protein
LRRCSPFSPLFKGAGGEFFPLFEGDQGGGIPQAFGSFSSFASAFTRLRPVRSLPYPARSIFFDGIYFLDLSVFKRSAPLIYCFYEKAEDEHFLLSSPPTAFISLFSLARPIIIKILQIN